MTGLESLSGQILGWAKRAALAQNRGTLTALDILCGVYAVSREQSALQRLKPVFGWPTGDLRWAEDIVALFGKASEAPANDQRMPLDETLRRTVEAAFAEDRTLPAERLLAHLLEQRSDAAVAKFLELNEPVGDRPKLSPLLEFMERVRSRAQLLEQRLATEVLGQDAAIGMLVSAYWEACLGRRPDGPQGIFTFLGPPGVGKTLLAERFAAALQSLEGTSVMFRRFDMGSFAAPQNFEQLLGTEGYYSQGRPGTLTGFVYENPRAVILFDEVEKAHENALTALLAVLDKGEVNDKNLQKTVDFRGCWFIFTTNLGREVFDSPNASGILGGSAVSRSFAFEILASARRRPEVGKEDTVPALPPELVSRLAKGGAVLFGRLSTSAHMQLMRQTIARDTDAARSATSLPTPEIDVDERAALLVLLSQLPNLDARQVVARTSAWGVQLQRDAFEACRRPLLESGAATFPVQVRCGAEAEVFLDEKLAGLKLRALLVDNDDYLERHLAEMCRPFSGELRRASTEAAAVETARRFEADIAFLDLSIDEGPDSAAVERALAILKALRARFPELPVWLYSENPEGRQGFDAVVPRILRDGGARGFIPCHYERENAVLAEDFLARLAHVVKEAAFDKLVRQTQRSHVSVAHDLGYRFGSVAVEASLTRVRQAMVMSALDQVSEIRFAGIPTERFSSVVGLARAKRRLADVVAWLRDPAALARFGITPPRGFLLAGPPGTGKTLLAKAVAGEADLPFLALSAGELRSKWHGESEERVRDLFRRAREYAPSLVFIDEIDAIGRRREGAGEATNPVLNQLLATMDGFVGGSRPVFVLAATNHPELLDSALLRPGRFDETIPTDLPNAAGREEFFRLRLASLVDFATVDVKRLVQPSSGLSPAELDRVVREAVYSAAAAGRETVCEADLVAALRLVRFGAAQEGIEVKPKERNLVAHHEAGHAIAQLRLFPQLPVDYLTIVPNEQGALGFLAPGQDEASHVLTRQDVEARLAVLLAGREAERLATGSREHGTSGASSDIEAASRLAWLAVSAWGLDEEIGPLSIAVFPEDARGGLSARAITRVEAWMTAAAERARMLLEANRDALERLASLLLERESLDNEDLRLLLGPFEAAKA